MSEVRTIFVAQAEDYALQTPVVVLLGQNGMLVIQACETNSPLAFVSAFLFDWTAFCGTLTGIEHRAHPEHDMEHSDYFRVCVRMDQHEANRFVTLVSQLNM